jgi:hypothetical protein
VKSVAQHVLGVGLAIGMAACGLFFDLGALGGGSPEGDAGDDAAADAPIDGGADSKSCFLESRSGVGARGQRVHRRDRGDRRRLRVVPE